MEQSREANHNNGNHYTMKTPFEARPAAPFWRVWTCIEALLAEHTNSKGSNSGDGETTTNSNSDNIMMQEPYRTTTIQVAWILQKWALKWAGQEAWTSVLNKRQLQHEVEESIVAIYHLHQWMMKSKTSSTLTLPPKPFIVVDVCGGKGLFSMLLSYMASEFWYAPPSSSTTTTTSIHHQGGNIPSFRFSWLLQKIVLLEKANVDWRYIHESNERANDQTNNTTNAGFIIIPRIEIWANTNLHDTEYLLTRFETLCTNNTDNLVDNHEKIVPLALSGIHLCKLLSPSLMNLANGLGADKNPYLCLSPCCMPRMVTTSSTTTTTTSSSSCHNQTNRTISIQLYETPQERQDRLNHNQQKASRRNRACFLCLDKDHWVRECPQLNGKSRTEQDAMVTQARDNTPCWNCGVVGHVKPDCPTPPAHGHGRIVISRRNPPTMEMNVSEIINAKTGKYERLCTLLAQYLEMSSGEEQLMICQPIMNSTTTSTESEPSSGHQQDPLAKKLKSTKNNNVSFQARVIESGLTTLGNNTHHQEGNWNSRRKSIFIVAER